MSQDKRITPHQSPFRLVLVLAVSIFVAEFSVMVLFLVLPPLSPWIEVILGSTLLVALVSPVVFFSVFRPLRVYIQEREEAEAGLRESEESYRDLVENSLELMTTHDLDGWILSANRAALEVLGYDRREYFGKKKNLRELLAPEVRDQFGEYLARIRKDGVATGLMLVQTSTGERRIWEYHNTLRTEGVGASIVRGMARDITERKRAEGRLAAQYLVTRTLADSATLAEATPKILRALCETLGWVWGALWTVDGEAGLLRCQEFWHDSSVEMAQFEAASRELTFAPGVGLPGRVWADGKPAWIPDVAQDRNFLRAPIAATENLHGAFAIPIEASSEVLGVMEFFSQAIREPEPELLAAMATVSNQIGQFIERKRAEAKIVSEQLFSESIINSLPGIFYLFDQTGKFLRWNKNFEQITGYSPEEIGTLSPLDLFVGPEKELIAQRIQEVFVSGASDAEAHLVSKSGQRTPYYFTGARIDSDDQPCLIGVGLDITERKRADEALRESEERYRDLFENANDIIYTHDLEGNYTSANRACEAITGYTCDESRKLNINDVVAPEYLQIARKALAYKAEGKGASAYELEIIAKDGHRLTLEVASRLIYHDGRPSGVQGIARDVTERKRAEADIRGLQEFQAAILSGVQHGIHGIDNSGRINFENPPAARMLGWEQSELIGKPAHVTMHHHRTDGSSYPVADCNIYATLHDGQPRQILGEAFWRQDGTSFPVEYSVAPMHSASGEVTGAVVVFDDISERKRAEAERQAITDIVQGVITASNLDELFSLAHQAIGKLLPAENCYVALYDKTSDLLHLPFFKDKFDPLPAPQRVGRGLTAFVLRRGRPMLLTPALIQELVSQGEIELVGTLPAAWLGVPLRTSTDTIGVLVVQHYENKNAYSQQDLELLSSVADQLALAIERKQMEIELKTNDMQLNAAQQIAHLGSWAHDAASGEVKWSDEEWRIFGLEQREFGPPFEEFLAMVHPDDRHIVKRISERSPQSRQDVGYDYRIIRPDGAVRVLRANCRILCDELDQVVKVTGTDQDITEHKRIEDDLIQSEQRFRDLYENASDLVCTMDLEGNLTSVNKSGERITGYTQSEAVKMNLAQIVTSEMFGVTWEMMKRKLEQDITTTAYELDVIRKDGGIVTLEISSRLLLQEGKEAGIQAIGRDITQRKRVEAELKLARDAAIESVQLKSEFLANMSHEIRTPMNGVIGMTGLLLDTDLDEEQRDCAETIRTSGEALLTIINDILDFSKIEAGKLHFETLDFLLNNVVEDTIELLAERALQKKIELASLIYSDVPTGLRGDPGRLRQVLTNLIGNAIKFTERGEVVVRVERESETNDEVVARFMVNDTGIGISETAQQSLFRAFTQADGSTTRKYGGTGLGLVISKQLVELMGGQMGVTSTPGQGSTFWFTARFRKQLAGAVVPKPQLMSLEKLRVLIVDDNATNRKILSHQLGSWGMIHQEADSGFHALELLRSAATQGVPYDLAVLDLMMPGMDGFEVARTIKSDPSIAGMHLVMLTSFGERGHGATAREAGVAAYLTKPVRQSQLFDCLANVISAAAVTPERDATSSQAGPKLLTKHTLKEAKMSSNKLILLAEDNIVNQKVAIRQLQKLGYRADAVANGREAIEALSRIRYDLVLMDCQMPEMDGYEATAEIRRQEGETRRTPIVAMTAHALTGDREKCIAAGMDEYITKPVKPEELTRVLELFCETPGTGPADRAGPTAAPLVDVERMHEMMGDGPVELGEIVNLYLDQMGQNLHKLDAAIASGNHVEVELIAHNCAGTSANCGMNAVAIPFRELEAAGRTACLDNAPEVLAQAHRLFEQTREVLGQHVPQPLMQPEARL